MLPWGVLRVDAPKTGYRGRFLNTTREKHQQQEQPWDEIFVELQIAPKVTCHSKLLLCNVSSRQGFAWLWTQQGLTLLLLDFSLAQGICHECLEQQLVKTFDEFHVWHTFAFGSSKLFFSSRVAFKSAAEFLRYLTYVLCTTFFTNKIQHNEGFQPSLQLLPRLPRRRIW